MLKKVLSFNGVAIIIGVLGSLASILTLFINQWNSQINLKWFVFTLFVAVTLMIILIKLVFDYNQELSSISPKALLKN